LVGAAKNRSGECQRTLKVDEKTTWRDMGGHMEAEQKGKQRASKGRAKEKQARSRGSL
jgi:hypothetical protein